MAPTPKPPFHLFLAGLVAVETSFVLLFDDAQQEETQQCIQCVAATMSLLPLKHLCMTVDWATMMIQKALK